MQHSGTDPQLTEPTSGDAPFLRTLREVYGYGNFRGIQLDIIRSIAAGTDTLGLMPTGGGKSLTFQVPALNMEGLCLVITPLIALMKDQVEHLRSRYINAACIHAGLSQADVERLLDNCIYGNCKFLYVSPERLSSPLFQQRLRRMNVSFITVDEAHCISQWGYDFRPSYLEISAIRELLPECPVLALTATATPVVVNDVCRLLSRDPSRSDHGFRVFRMSFERPNLRYIVRKAEDKMSMLLHILRSVDGPAIVYTRSREGSRDAARLLKEQGIAALYYHAGLNNADKDVRQREWVTEKVRVMVATNAFGMGIDKANVRLVVHLDLPDSLEAYFQEAGRAGRDGQTAYAVLLFNKSDGVKLRRRVADTFPSPELIRKIYRHLASFFQLAVGDGDGVTYEFNLQRFCANFHHFPTVTESALHILTRAGYLLYREDEESRSRIMFIAERGELYRLHMNPLQEAVLQSLMRRFTGLFAEYVYIDESVVAADCNTDQGAVYEALKQLTVQRVVHYIPRKRTPYITYLRQRVAEDDVVLSPAVYDERRQQYVQRIEAMLSYAESSSHCRSQQLLAYFGQTDAPPCGHCDVCVEGRRTKSASRPALTESLLQQLSDRRAHRPDELSYDGFTADAFSSALQQLVDEERVRFVRGKYILR